MNIQLTSPGEVSAADIAAITRLSDPGRRSVESAIAATPTRTLVARNGGVIGGMVGWSRLEWDSRMFGFEAGRLHFMVAAESRAGVLDQLCEAAVNDARNSGIRHLTARVSSTEMAGVQALERAGFETIDAILTFTMTLDRDRYLEGPNASRVRKYRSADLRRLCEIARTSYVYDRFHSDCALPEGTADRVHAEWVRNSCLGKAADHVVVAEHEGEVAGYVTCRMDRSAQLAETGVIILVATAAEARGHGVARSATLGALDWFRAQGATEAEVGTQFGNIAASRLYESCGFRVSASSVTLRKVL